MTIEKFAPRSVPFQASPSLREYLDDQMRRLQPLINGAAQLEDDEVISGAWDFSGNIDFDGDVSIDGSLTSNSTLALAVVLNGTMHHSRARFTAMNRWLNTSDTNRIQTSWRTEAAIGSFWGFIPEPSASADLNAGFGFDFSDYEWIVDDGTDFRVKNDAYVDGTIFVGTGEATLTDDGSLARFLAGSSTSVLSMQASAIQALALTSMSLSDDSTGTFTLPGSRQGGFLFLTASNTGNVMTGEWAFMYVDDNTSITLINNDGTFISVGNGSNPDVDGDINIWSETAGIISVKNRRGLTRRIQLVLMG